MWGPRTGFRWSVTLAAVVVATGLVAASEAARNGSPDGDPAPAAFRLEDGSVGCRLVHHDTLACRAVGSDVAAVLAADGSSHTRAVDVDRDAGTPVLLDAESWWHGAFSCRVHGDAVTCTAGGGAIRVERGGLGGVR
jgi:hypothetical protein